MHVYVYNVSMTYMAGRDVFSAKKIEQESSKAIYYTLGCHSSYRNRSNMRKVGIIF